MIADIKEKLASTGTSIQNLRVIFDIDAKRTEIDRLSGLMSLPDFWNDEQNATAVVKKLKTLKSVVEPWEHSFKKYSELTELADLAGGGDGDLVADIEKNIAALQEELAKVEFKTLLNGPVDANDAILSINAGAGGTEACDWVGMLLRMYTRWAEDKGYAVRTLDILPGEEAGVKNVTLLIEGEFSYGYLRTERGVHRLVRISPFDSNKRRHTSFASVDVIPDIGEGGDVAVDEKDLSIETFRAQGAGGQHMQKSDTAVRITHVPSGLSAQCQNERSQHQNKQTAMKVLKAKLYELQEKKRQDELAKHSTEKKRIEWGSQIRSYVLQPYTLIKDHRTDFETGNVSAVLDGKIDGFIEAFLRYSAQESAAHH
ncbi:MAG: peptide chain release factor 2 [Candidatus Omnitrophota bacterium]